MLTLLLGPDWTANRDAVLQRISKNVSEQKPGQILMVPELISHDMERRLCAAAGDTTSRFAEVLTFTRLAKRVSDAAGFGAPECLDNGGRLVAMTSATHQLHSKLKAYAAVETRPEFLTGLLDSVDEFKRCCVQPADLMHAAQMSEGIFAQKLEELSLILEAYNSICARGKRDPRDQMTWLLEQLEDSNFALEHRFFIDGFPDFSRQHIEILSHLITHSKEVVVSLTTDEIDSPNPSFEKAGKTAAELLRIASGAGIEAQIFYIPQGNCKFLPILSNLFQGALVPDASSTESLKIYQTESLYHECHAAAEQILKHIQSGCRYRDISIVCSDMTAYENMLNMVLSRYHIPVYQSGTEDILDKTVINTVLSAIDAAVGGFEQSDILRFLRSSLSPLDIEAVDRLENYAILWNISGSRWANTWEYHPEGINIEWTDEHKNHLTQLNADRNAVLKPLFHLSKELNDANNLNHMVNALYHFIDALCLDKKLQNLSNEMVQRGDFRNGQILGQLWEILLSALEQLSDMLGDTKWDVQTFSRLLRLLLSQYDVGTIPALLDAVMIGPVSALRCQQPKHLIVLGASEGSFPSYSGSYGVFTELERAELRKLGIHLAGGAIEHIQAEFSEIYSVFCGAVSSITIFCSDGQPSFLYRRLRDFVGGDTRYIPLGIASTDLEEVGAFLVRSGAGHRAKELGISDVYRNIKKNTDWSFGQIEEKTVTKLYGEKLNLSASQVDKLADCRLAYFMKYGLRLKERKAAGIDPAEFGTYVHAVLEDTGREVMRLGGFHKVSMEECLQLANQYSESYIKDHFSQIDSQRINYLFKRNIHELEMVVAELWSELSESEFEPAAFELSFGMDGTLDAVPITGNRISAQLRGFVDRVDVWKQSEHSYYRVIDYKSGKKDFDYCDVYNGLGLQMLLYMFALEENNGRLLAGSPKPAGVQYFPARVPFVSTEGHPDKEEAILAREKLWKRKGLLLADEAVLFAMEHSENPRRLSYTRKKDGSISGDLASSRQMQLLKSYVFRLLQKMVDDIASGCIEPNPYTRGSRHNACAFCPYDAVCHSATVPGRRDYAAMDSNDFWDRIEREMGNRG